MRASLSPGIRFSVRFFACLLGFSLLFWAFDLHVQLAPVQRAIASLSTMLQNLAGGHGRANGTHIELSALVLDINHECTGIFVVLLFASFVIGYPTSWAARCGALGIGIPLLTAVNILRLATLARIVEIYPDAFFYFHEYVWQGLLMVCVLVGAIAWAERYG